MTNKTAKELAQMFDAITARELLHATEGGDPRIAMLEHALTAAEQRGYGRGRGDGWQSMDSAPKDESPFLVRRRGQHAIVEASFYQDQEFMDGHPITEKYWCLHDMTNDAPLDDHPDAYEWTPIPGAVSNAVQTTSMSLSNYDYQRGKRDGLQELADYYHQQATLFYGVDNLVSAEKCLAIAQAIEAKIKEAQG